MGVLYSSPSKAPNSLAVYARQTSWKGECKYGTLFKSRNETFAELVQADIYVDKTGLIAYMNGCIGKAKHLIASSRPRRFGKTLAAQMLTSYYSKGCDSSEVFSNLEIAKDKSFELHLNKYDVISLDIQWMRGVAIGKIQEEKTRLY